MDFEKFKAELAEALIKLQTTSDIVIKREILRQLIWKRTDLIAVGQRIDGVRLLNVLDVMAGAGKSVAAALVWTDPAAKPQDDIIKAIGEILETKGVVEADIRNMALVAPIKAWAQLLKLQEIGQIKQSVADWLRETYGLAIMPSKLLTTDAVLLIKGPETVIHGVLRPGAGGVPQAEVVRH